MEDATEHCQVSHTFHQLAHLGNTHFHQLFRAPHGASLAKIIHISRLFPLFVNHDALEDFTKPMTMGELESSLKWFKKDKITGLDGWTIEFYHAFFEIIGLDLLKVVEECRTLGCMYEAINSTFIVFIPKVDSSQSFNDLWPISLCNFLYNIIAKMISNSIKPILSTNISSQKFSFLHKHQIHESIGTAQEALHFIKLKHLKGAILKIDLSKAFDWVSWLYLRIFLTHLGFPPHFHPMEHVLHLLCLFQCSYQWFYLQFLLY